MNDDDQYNFPYDPHRWNGMGYHDTKIYYQNDYKQTTIPPPAHAAHAPAAAMASTTEKEMIMMSSPGGGIGGFGVGGSGSGGGGRLRSSSTSTESSSNDIYTKRHRAGSISGRLRAASDLEECGLIDKNQKGVLKVWE